MCQFESVQALLNIKVAHFHGIGYLFGVEIHSNLYLTVGLTLDVVQILNFSDATNTK